AVSGSGWIAGHSVAEGLSFPFVLPPGGAMTPLPPPGGASAIAADIDLAASWVAGYTLGPFRPLVWAIRREGGEVYGEVAELPLPGGDWGIANGVNGLGHVAGTAFAADNLPHAVLWRPAAGGAYEIVDLGVGYAQAVSEAGVVVGSLVRGGAGQAFALVRGETVLLPHPPGCAGCQSFAWAASATGLVAGQVSTRDGGKQALLWDLEELEAGPVVLAEYLPDGLAGEAVLDAATSVNEAGEVLAAGEIGGRRFQVLFAPRAEVVLDGDGNGIRDACEARALRLQVETARLDPGEETRAYAIVTTQGGAEVDVTATAPAVRFLAYPDGVVAVSRDGTVRALAAGRATVRADFGSLSTTAQVTVGRFLRACIGSWHGTESSPLSVTLDAHCSDGSEAIVAARWTVSGGKVLQGMTVTHRFAAAGRHQVTLEVEDAAGRRVQTTETIDLWEELTPNVFRRGDANGDGRFDLSDAVRTLEVLFAGRGTLDCEDAADANDDGAVNVSDPIFSLSHLFTGGEAPPFPGAVACGSDLRLDGLGCANAPACAGNEPRDPVTGFRPDDYDYEKLDTWTRERPRQPGRPMHTGVGAGEVWTLPPDTDDPRDEPGPVVYGEELEGIDRPLIVVPGIMATALVDPATGSQVWPPYSEGAGGRRPITDLIKVQNKVPDFRGAAGLVRGFYNELIAFLQREMGYKLGETLFVFPYDWTRSNIDSGRKLAAFIRVVQSSRNPPWPDVDVIAHSMGGIVTRTAVIFNGAPVNRTVYLASPHYGASKAYFALHPDIAPPLSNNPWVGWAIAWVWDALVRGQNEESLNDGLRTTAQGMDSAWELLPDDFYFRRAGSPATAYGQMLVNPFHCYSYYEPTSFRDPGLNARAMRGMYFKEDLGELLPGRLNAILYNDVEETLDRVDWTIKWYWASPGFDDPYDSGLHGDGTVPARSGFGPGPSIQVPGLHTAIPNLRPTWNVIATFLSRT
ncbi:MAG: PKD domain-containing protein, partial [Planctomycetes bacterium]|nr:PKD domain-containing protein [Planctomycetota bacterium]